ncbi:MAG: hypothetical protein ACE5KH_02965 [Candidatus Geothermarchaeales archaeon]
MTEENPVSFRRLSIVFLAASLLILSYYLGRGLTGIDRLWPLGENMVLDEFPPPGTLPFPLYAKPVTYFAFFLVLGWIFGLESMRTKLASWNLTRLRFLAAVAGFAMYLAGYEVLFNFNLWSSLMASCFSRVVSGVALAPWEVCNPDTMFNPYPNPDTAWNLVFATKIYTAIFAVALLSFIYLWRAQRSR